MTSKFQFETSANSVAQELWQLTVLISELWRTVHNFETGIEAEERRSQVFDVANASYPGVARNFKARRDNLLVTLSMLENHLERADASRVRTRASVAPSVVASANQADSIKIDSRGGTC